MQNQKEGGKGLCAHLSAGLGAQKRRETQGLNLPVCGTSTKQTNSLTCLSSTSQGKARADRADRADLEKHSCAIEKQIPSGSRKLSLPTCMKYMQFFVLHPA